MRVISVILFTSCLALIGFSCGSSGSGDKKEVEKTMKNLKEKGPASDDVSEDADKAKEKLDKAVDSL